MGSLPNYSLSDAAEFRRQLNSQQIPGYASHYIVNFLGEFEGDELEQLYFQVVSPSLGRRPDRNRILSNILNNLTRLLAHPEMATEPPDPELLGDILGLFIYDPSFRPDNDRFVGKIFDEYTWPGRQDPAVIATLLDIVKIIRPDLLLKLQPRIRDHLRLFEMTHLRNPADQQLQIILQQYVL